MIRPLGTRITILDPPVEALAAGEVWTPATFMGLRSGIVEAVGHMCSSELTAGMKVWYREDCAMRLPSRSKSSAYVVEEACVFAYDDDE